MSFFLVYLLGFCKVNVICGILSIYFATERKKYLWTPFIVGLIMSFMALCTEIERDLYNLGGISPLTIIVNGVNLGVALIFFILIRRELNKQPDEQ